MSRKIIYITSFLAFVLFLGIIARPSPAQSAVEVDLKLQPQLTTAQVLSLANLGVRRSGAPLLNVIIRNTSNEPQNNLFLEIMINASKVGTIAEIRQVGRSFSLDPGQVVVANENQLRNGLPGVEESIVFNGGLTEQGEQFVDNLSGSINLPSDLYTVTFNLYQGNNTQGGGDLLETVEETFGENISEDTSVDLYLMQPGNVLGSNAQITSSLPVFRWDGPTNISYRLIIVEANDQSPETLIQSALGTEPTLVSGNLGTGSLLDFEILDAEVENITYPFPPSGVQNLKTGAQYYWQVFAVQESVNDIQSIPSEIWEFTIASEEANTAANVSGQMLNSLNALLGREQVERLTEQGFTFESITIEGQTLQGAAAVQKLQELSVEVENGDITVVLD